MLGNGLGWGLCLWTALMTVGCVQKDDPTEVAREKPQVPTEWNLKDLYTSDQSPEFQRDLHLLGKKAQAFSDKYKGHITLENLAEALKAYEDFMQLEHRVEAYAYLRHKTHLNDAKVSALYQKTLEIWTQVAALASFLPIECLKLSYTALQARMKMDPRLAHYRVWIENLFRNRRHVLSAPEEHILAKTSIVTEEPWPKLYKELMAQMDFKLNGSKRKLPYIHRQHMKDKPFKKRRAALEALSKGLSKHDLILTSIYNNILLNHQIQDDLRHFKAPEESRLLSDDVDPEVVKIMMAAVKRYYSRISHRYYKLEAHLTREKRHRQILYRSVPLSYSEAINQVMEVYSQFSPTFERLAKQFISEGWIDVYPKNGKASGCFSCPTSVDVHPYILLNFMGSQRDVLAMAHELGHGVHQYLSRGVGQLLSRPAGALSETASTFAEKLTYAYLIAKATDNKERIRHLYGSLEDFIGTVMFQAALFEFEQRAHAKRRDGELKTEDLNKIWREIYAEFKGESIPSYVDNYWMVVSHFFLKPFCVYSYVFGRLFVEALYCAYEKDPVTFRMTFEKFLARGGTINCEEAAKMFGFDLRSPAFWEEILSRVEQRFDELEKLCKEEGLLKE